MTKYKDKEAKRISEAILKSKSIIDSIRGLEENEKVAAFQTVLEYFLKAGDLSSESYFTSIPKTTEPKLIANQSFGGFVKKVNAKSQADKALAAVYFCLKKEKKPSISLNDIGTKYKEAFLKKSKNMNAEINSNLSKGYLMPSDEKAKGRKLYSITSDGIEHIEKKLKRAEKDG